MTVFKISERKLSGFIYRLSRKSIRLVPRCGIGFLANK